MLTHFAVSPIVHKKKIGDVLKNVFYFQFFTPQCIDQNFRHEFFINVSILKMQSRRPDFFSLLLYVFASIQNRHFYRYHATHLELPAQTF